MGGAIDASSSVSLSGNTYFKDNLVSGGTGSLGGAIYLNGEGTDPTLTLDTAITGGGFAPIAFTGNKVNVTVIGGVVDPSTGTPNAVHLGTNTRFDLKGDGNIYFDDPISSGTGGSNSLVKTSSGFVQFLGDNVLNTTGGGGNTVDIRSGTFRLAENATFDASGAGTFNVAGTLAGSGTITAESFTISGAISPDSDRFEIPEYVDKDHVEATATRYNYFKPGRTTLDENKKIGTLTLLGDALLSDAVITVDVDPTASQNSDLISVTGEAVVTGDTKLQFNVQNADQLGRGQSRATRILLLDSDSLDTDNADFTVFSNLSRLCFSRDLSVSSDLVYLLWLASFKEEYGSRLSPNGNRMAGLIDTLPDNSAFLDRLGDLDNDAAILSGIENSTGEGYAASMHGTVKLQQVFNDYLLARKTFTGGSHDRSGFSRYSGYDLSNYGVAFGVERELGRRWFGGIAFGYDNAKLKLDDRHAKNEFEAFRASLYGGYAGRNWYASGYAGYSKNWHDMKRNNPMLGFSNRGKYDDDVFSTGLELGRVLKVRNGAQFIPSIGIHWIHLDNPTFTERGDAASALRLSKSHYDSVRMPIGARLNRTFITSRDLWSGGITWTPEVRAFYIAELADTRSGLNTAFASSMGSGTAFADSGSSGRSGGQFGTGVMAQLTSRLSVGIDYDYEVWEHYDRHNLTGNVTWRW